jgi:Holliday junction DNA helicase RuvB
MSNTTLDVIKLQEQPDEIHYTFVPKTFDEYIGQDTIKQKLAVYTKAAKMRQEPLDHLLLFGPPGLGKTTLANIMAHVMEVHIKLCSGPMMERTGDLVAILSSLEPRDILFIDEIHRMPTNVEEVLYSAMEHFRVDVIIGQGAGAKSVSLPLHPFTLIGATTKSGMISAPLRSRFGITERLDFYEPKDLRDIVLQNAQFLQLPLSPQSALLIAQCARGTPRIAKKIVRRVRDFAQVHHHTSVDEYVVQQALDFLGLDQEGLTTIDNLLLQKMIDHFNGGPVGLETIASLIGEDAQTIETVYEPHLLRLGYLERTPRGRQIPHKKLPQLVQRFLGQTFIK